MSPASGERRAVRNIAAQYRVAASLAYDALLAGELEWVRLVDPEAGRLDDVIIARIGQLDAYQIKWSEFRHEVQFRDLVREGVVSGKPYPSPFALMVQGWQKLRTGHPNRRVHAHYLMHDAPSARDGMSGLCKTSRAHLQGFLREAFAQRHTWEAPDSKVRQDWAPMIDAIVAATGLAGDTFSDFIGNCHLDLDFRLPGEADARAGRRQGDVEALAAHFMKRVSDSTGAAVQIDRRELMADMSWGQRFDLRFKHDFPVDEKLYRPIERTVGAIEQALAEFDRGYLALVGTPGAGKSTTLTQTLRYRPGFRLVRYYAFVRDDPRTGRGEALAFVHDLCLALENIGVGRSRRLEALPETLEGLRERLAELLLELSQTGTRTVIMIDGLDHIEREQSPIRSLIKELPAPSHIPPGIVFVLGTQPVGLNGSSPVLTPIREHLKEPGRTIEMAPLSRASVHEIAREAIPSDWLRSGDEETIYAMSGGHPLALAYLVKRLAGAADAQAYAGILDEAPNVASGIEAEYSGYWDSLSADAEVKGLLALLARIRGPIAIDSIAALAETKVVERFVRGAKHLFRELTPDLWAFFHNSFRQYVLARSSVDVFGRTDARIEAGLHSRLAAIAATPEAHPLQRWQAIYHLNAAQDRPGLIALAKQDFFRAQFFEGRPLPDIREDIDRAIAAAGNSQDLATLAGLLLVNKELEERDEALGQTQFEQLQLKIADPAHRPARLMLDDVLRVPEEVALRWVPRLLAEGHRQFAIQLFDAAEPVAALAGVQAIVRTPSEDIKAWVRAAWRIRPLPQVIETIGHLRASDEHRPRFARGADDDAQDRAEDNRQREEDNRGLREDLLSLLGASIQDSGDQATYDELRALISQDALGVGVLTKLDFRTAQTSLTGRAVLGDPAAGMERVLAAVPLAQANDAERITFGDVLIRMPTLAERARDYIDVTKPPMVRSEIRFDADKSFDQFRLLFRQARARAAFGAPLSPQDIKDPDKVWDRGSAVFQRLVIVVGTLWGEAIAGKILTANAFVRRVRPVLAIRRRAFREMQHDWNTINMASRELYEIVLDAAHAHGRQVFEAICAEFLTQWRTKARRGEIGWPIDMQRRIVMAIHRRTGDSLRTEGLLMEFSRDLGADWELHERLEELSERANDWLVLGQPQKAATTIDDMQRLSFGIYHAKDRQIENWAGWLGRLIDADAPEKTILSAAQLLIDLSAKLYHASRGSGASDAVEELLRSLARSNPGAALSIGAGLLDQGFARRSAVLAGLLTAELSTSDSTRAAGALLAFARLLLPFDGWNKPFADALRALLAGPCAQDPKVREALDVFKSIAATRTQGGGPYLEIIEGKTAPVASPTSRTSRETETSAVKLAEGRILELPDLIQLAQRPREFATSLTGAAIEGTIAWTGVLDVLFSSEDKNDVRNAGLVLLQLDRSAKLAQALCKRGLGDSILCEAALKTLRDAGQPYAWARYAGGGSRLSFARSLRLVDPAQADARIMKLFIDDYVGQHLSPGEILMGLGDLMDVLSDQVPVEAIWDQIEQHLGVLADMEAEGPDLASYDGAARTRVPTPIALLMRDTAALSSTLAWEARRGLIDAMRIGIWRASVEEILLSALAGTHFQQASALAAVACLTWSDPDLCGAFVAELERLAWSPSGVARLAAQESLRRLGRPMPPAPPRRPLPALYQLIVPEAAQPDASLHGEEFIPGEPLPDTSDPFDLTRMFHPALHEIAEETDHTFDILVRRTAMLMDEVAPAASWSADAERSATDLNLAIELKLDHRRPRALVCQQAFGRLVAELCDAGALTWPPAFLREHLNICDPPINCLAAQARPPWLEVPRGEEVGKYPRTDWLEGTKSALPSLERTPDGRVVLAEITTVRGIDRERMGETRLSLLAHQDVPVNGQEPSSEVLLRQGRYAAEHYPDLRNFEGWMPMAATAGGSVLANSEFAALNPVIATHLGWEVAREGLFRWVDGSGAIMAESIFWAEGNIDLYDAGSFQETASEGWLVLASPEGWQRMRPLMRYFVRHRIAARHTGLDRDGSQDIKLAGDRTPLPPL